MLRCAKCGKENLDDALSCRECAGALSARDFDKGTTPPSASAPTAAEEARDSLIAAAARERAQFAAPIAANQPPAVPSSAQTATGS